MPDITLPDSTRGVYSAEPVKFITLDAAEKAALSTGQHRGMELTFSNDGIEWAEAWVPADDDDSEFPHPNYAKAIALRKMPDGDVVPTMSILRWAEFVPAPDSDRYDDWMRSPTMYLGKCAKVSSYRGAYRDKIGNRYEPAELDHVPEVAA